MTEVIVLPGASPAEGIAAGRGATFYAGDLLRGDIFRGDLVRGTAELFIEVPEVINDVAPQRRRLVHRVATGPPVLRAGQPSRTLLIRRLQVRVLPGRKTRRPAA